MLHRTLSALRSLIGTIRNNKPLRSKMAALTDAEKRKLDEHDTCESESKKAKVDNESESKLLKRKVAVLMMYSGVGYMGMQRNPPFPTIEEELMKAFLDVGCIHETHYQIPQKMQFQRAARTDKGVSAAGQCVSLKMWSNIPDLVAKVNDHLPKQIRVIDIIRTTQNFNSKNACTHRTYSYLIPTYAFTPIEEVTIQKYRAPEGQIEHVNQVLSLYLGTHNFHNFTSGKRPDDPSAQRYIMSMVCSQPFIREDIEFALITVKGQSFMLHQIRKMIGLMIAIVRGHTSEDSIRQAYLYPKFDVPKAPGLGLMLEHVHYDRYNMKFDGDGVHEKIEWDPYLSRIEAFKQEYIYSAMVETEKREKCMLEWLHTLLCHKFISMTAEQATCQEQRRTAHSQARELVWRVVKARKAESESEGKSDSKSDSQNNGDSSSGINKDVKGEVKLENENSENGRTESAASSSAPS